MIQCGKYVCLVVLLITTAATAIEQIANSKHDLSVHSPHPVRAVEEERICVFCHTPHNAQPQTPLWNRHTPTTHYRIYRSSTTDARIDQPSGPSKMCLSCHDGSLAVGLVRSRPATDPIPMTAHTLPPGPANLTNDLSDDHPIDFRYDRALSNVDPQLRDPQIISRKLSLGPHSEVHCTTCHDPHNNELAQSSQHSDAADRSDPSSAVRQPPGQFVSGLSSDSWCGGPGAFAAVQTGRG